MKYIQTFDFVFSLILLEDLSSKTNILSKYLQSSTLNYGLVIQMIKETINSFKELRAVNDFQKVWKKTATVSKNHGFSEAKLPRIRFVPLVNLKEMI